MSSEVRYLHVQENHMRHGLFHWFPRLTYSRAISCLAVVVIALFVLFFSQFFHRSLHFSDRTSNLKENSLMTSSILHSAFKHYHHTRRHLPQCIIIGVRKGGTRALLKFMDLHPYIVVAGSEMHFFDDDDNYSLGYDWYRKHMPFSFSDQVTTEKTPAYFVTMEAPARIHDMNDSIKLILIVREPIQRSISDYTQILSNRQSKNKSFPLFEKLAINQVTGEVNRHYAAIQRSVYHRHFQRWLRYFNLSQILIVDGDNLVKNPVQEMMKVESFLNLEHRVTQDHFYFNGERGFYCIKEKIGKGCLVKSKGRKHPEISQFVLNKLHRFFHPHNQKFFHLIGRHFEWN